MLGYEPQALPWNIGASASTIFRNRVNELKRKADMATYEEQQLRLEQRRKREAREVAKAKSRGEPRTYIDDDGCEVTITSGGHVFYNAADWY